MEHAIPFTSNMRSGKMTALNLKKRTWTTKMRVVFHPSSSCNISVKLTQENIHWKKGASLEFEKNEFKILLSKRSDIPKPLYFA